MSEPVAWMVDGMFFTSLGAALNISFDIEQPCIPLYTHPMRELNDEEILEKAINIFGVQRFEMLDDIYWTSFAKAIIKASRGEE